MSISKQQVKSRPLGELRLFGNVRVLVIAALFISASIVLGKYLSFTVGPFRISFENLTILMAGIMFGPLIGACVGVGADIVGCIMVGYAINPIITIGAGCIGLISGIMSRTMFREKKLYNIAVSVGAAHIIGSMIIKSIGLYVYYHFAVEAIMLRVPLYVVIGSLEFYIIYLLMKNKAFTAQLERVCRK